jgi:addiction module HigA family antidote
MPRLKPLTSGELLREEFLTPMGLSQYRLAREIGVPAPRIGEIVAGKRAVTADTDLRLCRFFGLSDGYWLRAQAAHDTEVAQVALAKTLAKIKPWRSSTLPHPVEVTSPIRRSRPIALCRAVSAGLSLPPCRYSSAARAGRVFSLTHPHQTRLIVRFAGWCRVVRMGGSPPPETVGKCRKINERAGRKHAYNQSARP